MCTTSYVKPGLMIAEHDIVTYKHVYHKKTVRHGILKLKRTIFYKSGINGFIYRKNKVYESELGEFKANMFTRYYESGAGFYSWETSRRANVRCIIPKGARYYKAFDIYEDRRIYISDRIKIIGTI